MNNLEEYISLAVDATVRVGIFKQLEAFRAGFNQVSRDIWSFGFAFLDSTSQIELYERITICACIWCMTYICQEYTLGSLFFRALVS